LVWTAEPRAIEARFLLNREQESERRMREPALEDFQRSSQYSSDAGTIVGAESRLRINSLNVFALPLRLASNAYRHSINMGHQQSPRTATRTRQPVDEVACVAACGRLKVCAVCKDTFAAQSRRPAPLGSSRERSTWPCDSCASQEVVKGRCSVPVRNIRPNAFRRPERACSFHAAELPKRRHCLSVVGQNVSLWTEGAVRSFWLAQATSNSSALHLRRLRHTGSGKKAERFTSSSQRSRSPL
jgi:hypothetical protein